MTIKPSIPSRRALAACLAVLALSACTTLSKDGGLDAVSALTAERTGQDIRFVKGSSELAQAELAAMLKQPLSADAAVRIALLNNRGLRAALGQLGVAEADLVQAGRMANPSFSFGR